MPPWLESWIRFLAARDCMYLAKVVGNVVCSIKNDGLVGKKLLLVKRLPDVPESTPVVAVDAVGAGVGETVYICRGKESSFAFAPEETPTDATIVGIVDRIAGESTR
jgi:ethanolamine utilization protein EutN